jgi:hypothetical protein
MISARSAKQNHHGDTENTEIFSELYLGALCASVVIFFAASPLISSD